MQKILYIMCKHDINKCICTSLSYFSNIPVYIIFFKFFTLGNILEGTGCVHNVYM